ncbi:MAG: hypothetical protein FWD69_08825 [Polyangiaceae bacterium]|nr:hypothetical protein [Polyangiaceae bacterium]
MLEEPKEAELAAGKEAGTEVDENTRVVLPDEPTAVTITDKMSAAQAPPAKAKSNRNDVASAIDMLGAESDAAIDRERRARLLNEAGELHERTGDVSSAERDYLAAFNADTNFREPLESLVRILVQRGRAAENLGRFLDELVEVATTPEERARALTVRALYNLHAQQDFGEAQDLARQATETRAKPADLGAAWLALEMVAAKLGDTAQREAALAGRAGLASDPMWRGLLVSDVANLAAESGNVDRALQIAQRAMADGGVAGWFVTSTVERIIRAEPGLAGSDEARERARILAEVLETRAMILESTLADPAYGDSQGVPGYVRTPAHAVFELVSAAQVWRAADNAKRAASALDRALEILARPPADTSSEGESAWRETRQSLERIVRRVRLVLADRARDTALATDLAAQQLTDEPDGGGAASLAVRIAEHAASAGHVVRALDALTKATTRDPLSLPAHALKIDLLESAGENVLLAEELEELSKHYSAADARGRVLLLAAYVWAVHAGDAARARTALGHAAACGVGKDVTSRLGRSLASLRDDDAWYEDATRDLARHLKHEGEGATLSAVAARELPLLWVEVARMRFAQKDDAGAMQAIRELRNLDEGLWLGRVLEGFAAPMYTASDASADERKRARDAVVELAAGTSDAPTRVELSLVNALRAHEAGDTQATLLHLRAAFADNASDPLVAAYLGDLLRAAGDRAGAADLAVKVADASRDDQEQRGARRVEAGLERWKLEDRNTAFLSFQTAAADVPEAATPLLAWAARGIGADNVEGRRRAIELADQDSVGALERFALEVTAGDQNAAQGALADVDAGWSSSIRLAGALGRIAWSRGAADALALDAALATLADTGSAGAKAAAAERLRVAREAAATGKDADVAGAAEGWLNAGGGAAAAMEWLAATIAASDVTKEISARRALADMLADEAREAMHASAALLDTIVRPDDTAILVTGSSPAARLANLELAPPGCDPKRRASVLSQLGDALGEAASVDAVGLAAWSALTTGNAAAALDGFRAVTIARGDELHAWEGMRAAASRLGDRETFATACEELGARVANAERGSAFWEQAALTWLALGDAHDARADAALEASFARDARREVAFDKLFRRVRDRKDGDKLLTIVSRRLEVTRDPAEITKMYWEKARVLREKGDPDGALEALEHVTTLDRDHVGALALTSEIFIRRGMFAEAADKLARLSRVEKAPPKNRVTAGIGAADIYENKLGRHDLALGVLLGLNEARLTTLPVRERLARTAARAGSWDEATRILEELMIERPEAAGRIEAARLAMVIHRDRRGAPEAALPAATKLLTESPSDGEALDLVVGLDAAVDGRAALLERGRDALLSSLGHAPDDAVAVRRLARVAKEIGDAALEQSALSCVVALSGSDGANEQRIAQLSKENSRVPRAAFSESMLKEIVAPGDDGPIADLFAVLGATLSEALGPSLATLGVHPKRDRIEPRAGLALRTEIAAWASAFGIAAFDLYVGGKDSAGVQGIAGATPAVVVGTSVNAPLSPTARARVARELYAATRGTTVTRQRSDATIAAIVVAACNLTKVRIDHPPLAMLAEVEKAIGKALSRKTKAQIEPICRAIAASHGEAREWAAQTRASQARIAAVASGDVAAVLDDMRDDATASHGAIATGDRQTRELLRFVLSHPYFNVRRALGLES